MVLSWPILIGRVEMAQPKLAQSRKETAKRALIHVVPCVPATTVRTMHCDAEREGAGKNAAKMAGAGRRVRKGLAGLTAAA